MPLRSYVPLRSSRHDFGYPPERTAAVSRVDRYNLEPRSFILRMRFGSDIRFYKNGVHRSTASFDSGSSFPIADGDLRNGNAPVRIGTRDLNSFLKEPIDSVLVYNRKLTATEVQQVYNDTTN